MFLQLWAYSYLRPLAPSVPGPPQYPAAMCWARRQTLRPQDALIDTRKKIKRMKAHEVDTCPWFLLFFTFNIV